MLSSPQGLLVSNPMPTILVEANSIGLENFSFFLRVLSPAIKWVSLHHHINMASAMRQELHDQSLEQDLLSERETHPIIIMTAQEKDLRVFSARNTKYGIYIYTSSSPFTADTQITTIRTPMEPAVHYCYTHGQ